MLLSEQKSWKHSRIYYKQYYHNTDKFILDLTGGYLVKCFTLQYMLHFKILFLWLLQFQFLAEGPLWMLWLQHQSWFVKQLCFAQLIHVTRCNSQKMLNSEAKLRVAQWIRIFIHMSNILELSSRVTSTGFVLFRPSEVPWLFMTVSVTFVSFPSTNFDHFFLVIPKTILELNFLPAQEQL